MKRHSNYTANFALGHAGKVKALDRLYAGLCEPA